MSDAAYMREMLRQRAQGRVGTVSGVFPQKKARKKPKRKPARKPAARGPRRKTCLSKTQLVRLLALVQSITPAQMRKLQSKAAVRLERNPPGRGSSYNKSVYVAEIEDRLRL